MKNISTILSRIALAGIIGGAFAACTQENSPGTTTVNGPTGVMVRSVDANSIAVKWTRDASDVGPDTVVVTGGATPITQYVASNASTVTVSGLTTQTVYTFTIHGNGGTSTPMQWMTAVRTNGIKMYQFSSSGASGLALNNGGTAAAVSATTANQDVIDFILDDNAHDSQIPTPPGISFESAGFVFKGGTGWRQSGFDTTSHYVVGGLDNDWSSVNYAAAINSIHSYVGTTFDFSEESDYATKGSRVLLAQTPEGNFAKIEFVPDPNTGKLYWGTGSNKYLTLNVSYQPMANQPYARRGLPVYHGPMPRIVAH